MALNVRITYLLELKKQSQANSCTQPAVPIGPPGGAARPASAFLSEQSFGYCPRAKRSRSNTRASIVGYLF
jgi:hypothetical protein